MEYEFLVRNAFANCGRFGDPLRLADADIFDGNCLNLGRRLIFGISHALQKSVVNSEDSGNHDLANSFRELDNRVWERNSQEDLNELSIEARDLQSKL